jgi:hypothetical protein
MLSSTPLWLSQGARSVTRACLSHCRKRVPPQSPCRLVRLSLAKMLNSLDYLVFRLRGRAVVMESSNIC